MTPTIFDGIDVVEKVNLSFPFASEMEVGETITSVDVTLATKSGDDATPSACKVGLPLVVSASFEVVQRIQGRVSPVTYKARCTATLSSGRVLVRLGELSVSSFI